MNRRPLMWSETDIIFALIIFVSLSWILIVDAFEIEDLKYRIKSLERSSHDPR